jgi:hypothetical protein
MKSNRNRAFLKNTPPGENSDYFSITRILPNIIFVAIIIAAYWFVSTRYIFPDYNTYIYWAVNVLVTYNIIVTAARSFLPPIITLIAAAVIYFVPNMMVLTMAEFYQLLIVGIIALLISVILKL